MPKRTLPRITAVAAGDEPMTLRIRWNLGDETVVDVSPMIEAFRVYEPLRRDPALFGRVRAGEHGTDVVWSDDIDMSADTLWRLAQEQSGATLSPEAFRRWRERHAFTLDRAAKALGVSRRMVAYFEQGKKPIPGLSRWRRGGWRPAETIGVFDKLRMTGENGMGARLATARAVVIASEARQSRGARLYPCRCSKCMRDLQNPIFRSPNRNRPVNGGESKSEPCSILQVPLYTRTYQERTVCAALDCRASLAMTARASAQSLILAPMPMPMPIPTPSPAPSTSSG